MTRTEAHVSINDVATTTTKQFNDLSDIVQKSRDSLLKGNKLFVRNEITEALNNSTQAIDAGKKECELIFNSAREYVRSIEDLAYLFDQGEIAEVLSDYFSKALVELSKTEALVELYIVNVDKKMIIFINLDYTVDKRAVKPNGSKYLGLQEGFKEKQVRYRGLKTDGVVAKEFKKKFQKREVVVREDIDPITKIKTRVVEFQGPTIDQEITYMTSRVYGLLGSQYKEKKYVEISIHYTSLKDYKEKDPTGKYYYSVDRSPDLLFKDDVIDDLKGLDTAADKCKLIISGHGDSEADSIQSDAEHDMSGLNRYDLKIEGLADFLQKNINHYCKPDFFSIDRPLPISLMCCQSAGLKAFENRPENEISLENTMAGKLLISLKNAPLPIYAKVKARTTNVASVKSSPRADVVESKKLSAVSLDNPSQQEPKPIVGTSQVRRGLGGVNKKNSTLYAFYNDTTQNTNAYGVGYGVQGKDFRVKGYKYAFYYVYENGVPKFKAVDLSDKSDVDPIFEVNKDRLIQYVYGLAYYVYEQHEGLTQQGGMKIDRLVERKVREKKNAILKYLYDIELANNRGEIVNILTRMTNDRAITANLNWYGFGETRTVKLINILKGEFTGPQKGLLDLANLDNKNLGLV